MNKIFLFLILGLFLAPFVNAEVQSLGTFKQNTNVNLIQSCTSSTYANVTRVIYPDSTFALNGNYEMTKNGDNYNYTFHLTSKTGRYLVYGVCDEAGTQTNWQYDFEITQTGDINNYIIFWVVGLLLLSVILFIAGYTTEDLTFLSLAGISFIASGIYIYINGIPGLNSEFVLNIISTLISGIGAYIILRTALSWLDESEK